MAGDINMAVVQRRSLGNYPVSLQLAARAVDGDQIRCEVEAVIEQSVLPAHAPGKRSRWSGVTAG